MITVREYTEKDRPTLVRFMEELQDYLVGIDPLKRLIRPPEYGEAYTANLLKKLGENNGVIFFAEDEGQPIGCVAGCIDEMSPEVFAGAKPARKGTVEEMYVAASHRKKGIGSVLLERIEDYFRKHDCEYARVDVFEPNPAHAFYAKHGYGDRLRKMHKEFTQLRRKT